MSGGHFDYAYIGLEEMMYKLETELSENNLAGFSPETLERLRRCQHFLQSATKIAHDVEWLFSSDYGEETFAREVDDLLNAHPH